MVPASYSNEKTTTAASGTNMCAERNKINGSSFLNIVAGLGTGRVTGGVTCAYAAEGAVDILLCTAAYEYNKNALFSGMYTTRWMRATDDIILIAA